jgi:toxin ParE1/3/4
MTHQVIFDEAAEDDLRMIGEWIAERASVETAIGYVERLRSYCRGFDIFPARGTLRDDLEPGLRTIGFERRVLIAFKVYQTTVVILRVLYGGRDLGAVFDTDHA